MRRPSAEHLRAVSFVFQWQAGARFVQVLSTQGKPSPHIVASKPGWTTGSTG